MALLTGLAAGFFKYTWGTGMYGVSERVLLGLGMCWISALALVANPPALLRFGYNRYSEAARERW
jgi:hypothetical protein